MRGGNTEGSQTSPTVQADSAPPPNKSESGTPIPGSPEEFAEILRTVDEAAREWGLRPDEPEGRFVSALMGAIGWFARLHETAVKRLEAVAAERATVAKMQLDAAAELRRHAEAALHQARTAMIQEEVIRENLVARMIDQTLPMFAERLQKCLVIKEWVYNTRVRQRRFYLHAAIGAAVIIGSYVVGRIDQSGPSQNETLGAYCHRNVFQSAGHAFCVMDDFVTQSEQR
jgi:hypothetical protein